MFQAVVHHGTESPLRTEGSWAKKLVYSFFLHTQDSCKSVYDLYVYLLGGHLL